MDSEGGVSQKSTAPAVVLVGHGGYDKLKIEDYEIPNPEEDEVLIEMFACGLNFADLMARQGFYDRCPKLPGVLGMEGSGIIKKVGQSVTEFSVGDRVGVMAASGLWKSFCCAKTIQCFKMPSNMSFEEAAAIPVNYITAHQMLFNFGAIKSGSKVLVHMAAGGVGIAATQICKSVGGVEVFGTASASKHKTIESFGVQHPIDYRTKDFEQEVRKISPEGVDVILDPLLGEDSKKGYRLLKPFGKLIHFGAANMVTGEKRNYLQVAKTWFQTKSYSALSLMPDNKSVCGYHLGHLASHQHLIRETLMEIVKLYEQGDVKPQIDSVWHYTEVDKAMERMHSRKNVGKVILTPKQSVADENKV